MVPWIVVGLLAVVALVVSIVVVNVVRGGADEAEPTPTTSSSEPAPSTDSDADSDPDPDPDPEERESNKVPDVNVGATFTMNITQWNASSEVSNKLGGDARYRIDGDNVILNSSLIEQLPEACSAMRNQWGATRSDDSFSVLKPVERCDEAPELYDEIWGLMDAFAKSITVG